MIGLGFLVRRRRGPAPWPAAAPVARSALFAFCCYSHSAVSRTGWQRDRGPNLREIGGEWLDFCGIVECIRN